MLTTSRQLENELMKNIEKLFTGGYLPKTKVSV